MKRTPPDRDSSKPISKEGVKRLKSFKRLRGIKKGGIFRITPPPDKSISHRALILGAISQGECLIEHLSTCRDVISTISCLRRLGIRIRRVKGSSPTYSVRGEKGLFDEPRQVLNAGNSATTMRLLSGILAGRSGIHSIITGDSSLCSRPMARIVRPLIEMGGDIRGRDSGRFAPLSIYGRKLHGIRWRSSVSSAQVKSALMLAMFEAEGTLEYMEPSQSRDHTERFFEHLGIPFRREEETIVVEGFPSPEPFKITVTGDFSSAFFFIVLGAIVPGMDIEIDRVGLNPTRTGALEVLKKMGADIEIIPGESSSLEPEGEIRVRYSGRLKGVEIGGEKVPTFIDEIPGLCVAGALANGKTVIKGAEELRVKESDRIKAMGKLLTSFGVEVDELDDGIVITGSESVEGTLIDPSGDHRIAMAGAILAKAAKGDTILMEPHVVRMSFPNFFEILEGEGDFS